MNFKIYSFICIIFSVRYKCQNYNYDNYKETQLESNTGCIWYGECSNRLNCAYRGPSKVLEDEKALSTLKKICPHLYSNGSGMTYYIILY